MVNLNIDLCKLRFEYIASLDWYCAEFKDIYVYVQANDEQRLHTCVDNYIEEAETITVDRLVSDVYYQLQPSWYEKEHAVRLDSDEYKRRLALESITISDRYLEYCLFDGKLFWGNPIIIRYHDGICTKLYVRT